MLGYYTDWRDVRWMVCGLTRSCSSDFGPGVVSCCFPGSERRAYPIGPDHQYVVVQPIDVCSNTGTLCAPFNTKSTTGNPANTNQGTNPIGFVVNPATGRANPTTGGVDVTRAMLNQIGVGTTFNNIIQYNSPLKLDGTTYQTLNVVQTTNNAGQTIFQSQDFLTLSDRRIAHQR